MFDKKEYKRKWHIKNRKKILERVKKWRQENKQSCKQYSKEYYEKNKDKLDQYRRRWAKNNPEKATKYTFIYQKNHPEIREQYKRNHPERIKARTYVNYLIRIGKLVSPKYLKCKCGKPAKEYHHYLGYDKEHWEDVEVLCFDCHKKEELKNVIKEEN